MKLLSNKKYSGIVWAIIIGGVLTTISLLMLEILSGVKWFLFSSLIRAIFGVIILFVGNKLYGITLGDILNLKNNKKAFIAGTGFLLYFIYYVFLSFVGAKEIQGLTTGLLISRIVLQQFTTGFYEELNYRFLILEGYFFNHKSIKNKLLYSFSSALLFGSIHIVTGWDIYIFLQTAIIGFAFAVIYLESGNIVIPMIFHFIYDIFANLNESYVVWNNSDLFIFANSIFEIVLVIMFAVSLIILLVSRTEGTPSKIQTAESIK